MRSSSTPAALASGIARGFSIRTRTDIAIGLESARSAMRSANVSTSLIWPSAMIAFTPLGQLIVANDIFQPVANRFRRFNYFNIKINDQRLRRALFAVVNANKSIKFQPAHKDASTRAVALRGRGVTSDGGFELAMSIPLPEHPAFAMQDVARHQRRSSALLRRAPSQDKARRHRYRPVLRHDQE